MAAGDGGRWGGTRPPQAVRALAATRKRQNARQNASLAVRALAATRRAVAALNRRHRRMGAVHPLRACSRRHAPRRPPQARSRTVRAASPGPGTSAMIVRSRPSPVKNVTRGVTGKLNIPPKTAALAGEGCADNQRRGREREREEGGAECEQPGGVRPLSPSLLLSCVLAASSRDGPRGGRFPASPSWAGLSRLGRPLSRPLSPETAAFLLLRRQRVLLSPLEESPSCIGQQGARAD